MPSHIISVISLCWSLECTYISDAGDLDVRNLGALDFNKMGAGNCTGRNDASAITILQAIAIKSTIFLAIPSIYQSPPHNGHATALHGVPSSSLFPSTPSIGEHNPPNNYLFHIPNFTGSISFITCCLRGSPETEIVYCIDVYILTF